MAPRSAQHSSDADATCAAWKTAILAMRSGPWHKMLGNSNVLGRGTTCPFMRSKSWPFRNGSSTWLSCCSFYPGIPTTPTCICWRISKQRRHCPAVPKTCSAVAKVVASAEAMVSWPYAIYLFHGIWWEHVKHCSMFPLRRLVAQNIGSRDIGPALKMKHPKYALRRIPKWEIHRFLQLCQKTELHQVHLPFVNFTPFLCLLQDQQTKTPRLRDRHQRIEADAILHCCRPLWIAARRGCEWLLWIHNWVTTTCCSVALTSNQQANPLG